MCICLITSQRAFSDPPSHPLPPPTRHDAVHCLQCMWMYCCPHLWSAIVLTPLYLTCIIIGSKNMLLVRFYLLCYGYESTFCWLTKQWSILDVCIVTQITNLKYNRDKKTVFVTVCFCLHLGDIVRSRTRSEGKETREGPSLVRAFSRGSPLLATRNGEISRRLNCYMVKYCNKYVKFP